MRAVLIGASPLAVATAQELLRAGHEVVIIERNADKIEELEEHLDCGFVHADGSRPAALSDVSPENTDLLYCLTDSDQDNIIASLVGRSLEFDRVVTKIEDPDFRTVCEEIGLTDTIVPDRTVGRSLARMIDGDEQPDLGASVQGDIRFATIKITEELAGAAKELDLPEDTRAIAISRDDETAICGEGSRLKAGDEVLVIANERGLKRLRERFDEAKRIAIRQSHDS